MRREDKKKKPNGGRIHDVHKYFSPELLLKSESMNISISFAICCVGIHNEKPNFCPFPCPTGRVEFAAAKSMTM
jgi:hypothetical protein